MPTDYTCPECEGEGIDYCDCEDCNGHECSECGGTRFDPEQVDILRWEVAVQEFMNQHHVTWVSPWYDGDYQAGVKIGDAILAVRNFLLEGDDANRPPLDAAEEDDDETD
jgi:hypothetical protein